MTELQLNNLLQARKSLLEILSGLPMNIEYGKQIETLAGEIEEIYVRYKK